MVSYFKWDYGQVQQSLFGLVYEVEAKKGGPLNLVEIACGGNSTRAIKMLMMGEDTISSYKGFSMDPKTVAELKSQGLDVELIREDHDYDPIFKEIAKKGNGVLIMFGLPELAPDAARSYASKAKEHGLGVIAIPEI